MILSMLSVSTCMRLHCSPRFQAAHACLHCISLCVLGLILNPHMLQFAVAEGLVWRAVEVYQHLDLGALSAPSEGQQVAAAADTPVQIALVTLTDLALAVR